MAPVIEDHCHYHNYVTLIAGPVVEFHTTIYST
jgi:hypothetical protein